MKEIKKAKSQPNNKNENYLIKATSPGFMLLCQLLKKGEKNERALATVNNRYGASGILFDLDDCKIIREGIERGYM